MLILACVLIRITNEKAKLPVWLRISHCDKFREELRPGLGITTKDVELIADLFEIVPSQLPVVTEIKKPKMRGRPPSTNNGPQKKKQKLTETDSL